MHAVIYISKADSLLSREDVKQMLSRSKSRNEENRITGCIIYHKNHFIQLIEGSKQKVHSLYQSIKEDKRHREVTTLFKNTIEKRLFAGRSMAFFTIQNGDESAVHKQVQLEQILNKATIDGDNKEAYEILEGSAETLLAKDDHRLFNTVRKLFGS